jgi:hypothetical protein
MPFPRKISLVAPLVAALLGTVALPVLPGSAAHGGAGRPAVLELAVLPRRPRVRRRRALAGRRVIALQILGRRRRCPAALRAREQNLWPRLPLRDSYARGPPRPCVPAFQAGRPRPPGEGRAAVLLWVRGLDGVRRGGL